jgi:Fe-S-cluster containining protein
MSEPVPPAGDLCVKCGICCDSLLFDHAFLDPDEEAGVRALGFTITEVGGQKAFTLPCGHLKGTACQVYEVRPRTCRLYTCETLRAVNRGDIDRAEADRRVVETKAAMAAMREHLLPGETFSELRKRFTRDPAPSAEFRLAFIMSNIMLDRYLRRPAHRVLDASLSEPPPPPEPNAASAVSDGSCTGNTTTPAGGASAPGSPPSRSTRFSPPD